jgi:hypothetical protein
MTDGLDRVTGWPTLTFELRQNALPALKMKSCIPDMHFALYMQIDICTTKLHYPHWNQPYMVKIVYTIQLDRIKSDVPNCTTCEGKNSYSLEHVPCKYALLML